MQQSQGPLRAEVRGAPECGARPLLGAWKGSLNLRHDRGVVSPPAPSPWPPQGWMTLTLGGTWLLDSRPGSPPRTLLPWGAEDEARKALSPPRRVPGGQKGWESRQPGEGSPRRRGGVRGRDGSWGGKEARRKGCRADLGRRDQRSQNNRAWGSGFGLPPPPLQPFPSLPITLTACPPPPPTPVTTPPGPTLPAARGAPPSSTHPGTTPPSQSQEKGARMIPSGTAPRHMIWAGGQGRGAASCSPSWHCVHSETSPDPEAVQASVKGTPRFGGEGSGLEPREARPRVPCGLSHTSLQPPASGSQAALRGFWAQ